jgi:hypothetical protein
MVPENAPQKKKRKKLQEGTVGRGASRVVRVAESTVAHHSSVSEFLEFLGISNSVCD